MNRAGRDDEGQGDRQQEPLTIGWQILAVFLLSPAFAIFGNLLGHRLGMTDSSNPGLVGMMVALLLIGIAAPRTAKQLGLIVAIVALGGVLAILAGLAFEFLGWGLWGDVLGGVAAASVGSGFIVLCFFRLGVELRRRPESGQT